MGSFKKHLDDLCMAILEDSHAALNIEVPVIRNPWKLYTQELCTPELCLAAVQKHGINLAHVPWEMRTPELCMAAVQNHGIALGHVPREMRTFELCLTAVQNHGAALFNVPPELCTDEMCYAARHD